MEEGVVIGDRASRRWGDDRAILDDDEARRLLLEATSRCIVRRGDARIRMSEVAEEAGVARSTVYRYFAGRDELILGLLLSRLERALGDIVRSLPSPDEAAGSLLHLVLDAVGLVDGNPLNEALFSPGSSDFVSSLELTSEPLVDVSLRHVGPLLEAWQADGQLHDDLDIRETIRWINAVSVLCLSPPWRQRTLAEKKDFLGRYLIRALVVPKPV